MSLNKTYIVQYVNINLRVGNICYSNREFMKHSSQIWRFIIRLYFKKCQGFRHDEAINCSISISSGVFDIAAIPGFPRE